MQPASREGDQDLLTLAEATDRVADALADRAIQARLRAIADEVRKMARHVSELPR